MTAQDDHAKIITLMKQKASLSLRAVETCMSQKEAISVATEAGQNLALKASNASSRQYGKKLPVRLGRKQQHEKDSKSLVYHEK